MIGLILRMFHHSCLHAFRACKYKKKQQKKKIYREVARASALVTPTFSSHESWLEETQKLSAKPSVESRHPALQSHSGFLLFLCCSTACRATATFMAQADLRAETASLLCFSGTPVLQFTTSQLTVVETRTLDHRKGVHALATSSTAVDISKAGGDVHRVGFVSLYSSFLAVCLRVALAFSAE